MRAERLAAEHDAQAIRQKAADDAAQMLSKAASEREIILQAGYHTGLQQGLAQAATASQAAAVAIERFWQVHEAELGELALAVAHRVLGSLPCHETTAQLAHDAIADHARGTQLALRLAPAAAAALRKALGDGSDSERIAVIADPAMAPGECTLLHPRGRTEVGLLAQFRTMMQSVARHGSPETTERMAIP